MFDIETCCEFFSGDVKVIASIEDPSVIKKILVDLEQNISFQEAAWLPVNTQNESACDFTPDVEFEFHVSGHDILLLAHGNKIE